LEAAATTNTQKRVLKIAAFVPSNTKSNGEISF